MLDTFEIYKQLLTSGSTSDMSLFCNGSKEDIIIIGGTREQTFNLPFSFKLIKKIAVVYVQDDHIVIKKTNEDFIISDFDDTLLYFTLSELETILFKEGPIKVQMKILLEDGSILVSDVFHTKGVMSIDGGLFVDGYAPIIALQADVDSNDITLTEYSAISAGAENLFKIKFIFDSSWDIYTKIINFKDEYNNIVISALEADNTCYIPPEIIKRPGNIYVSINGGYENVQKVSTWSNAIRVITSPLYEGITGEEFGGEIRVESATESLPGVMKLYDDSGYNTDGTITQRKVTEGFENVKLSVDPDGECLVLDIDF